MSRSFLANAPQTITFPEKWQGMHSGQFMCPISMVTVFVLFENMLWINDGQCFLPTDDVFPLGVLGRFCT